MIISTSRIGRVPVPFPKDVFVSVDKNILTIKGPKGTLVEVLHPFINLKVEENKIEVQLSTKLKKVKKRLRRLYYSIAGTVSSIICNMVHGVSQGFERKLVIMGAGYKARLNGKQLHLDLGYSNDPTIFNIPEELTIELPSQTEILIKGIDNEKVGSIAAIIRAMRLPNPYTGKGIRYANEEIELKETKKK